MLPQTFHVYMSSFPRASLLWEYKCACVYVRAANLRKHLPVMRGYEEGIRRYFGTPAVHLMAVSGHTHTYTHTHTHTHAQSCARQESLHVFTKAGASSLMCFLCCARVCVCVLCVLVFTGAESQSETDPVTDT